MDSQCSGCKLEYSLENKPKTMPSGHTLCENCLTAALHKDPIPDELITDDKFINNPVEEAKEKIASISLLDNPPPKPKKKLFKIILLGDSG